MARKSIIEREQRRTSIYLKYRSKRESLKEKIRLLQKDTYANYELLQQAYLELRELPRDASPSRMRRRCKMTGRSRGVYRKMGLARSMFRIHAMNGDIPGLVKASW